MRFHTGQHRYYCGIDLHARTMYSCILDHETGKIVLHRNVRSEPEAFLRGVAPYRTLKLLKTIPGVGRILALTLLYEIHDITRFARVGDFLSYARLVKSQTTSAGKVTGTSGAKIGNAHLKSVYSEAAVLFLQKNPRGQRLIQRLRSKHGKGKALSILAARLGRASYFMLRRSSAFEMDRFVMN